MPRIVLATDDRTALLADNAFRPLQDWISRAESADREDLRPNALHLVPITRPTDLQRACEWLRVRELRQLRCDIWLVAPGPLRLPAELTAADAVFVGPQAAAEARAELARRQSRQGKEPGKTETLKERLEPWTPSLVPLAERLAPAAEHDVTVLLTGETGSGKTFLARLLHESSSRREHRLVVVPCGAIAPNLVESEFFGHVKGAFTGADRTRTGRFAAAGQGTLLLDEIDALSLEQQANLLRIVETGEYELVGSHETQRWQGRLIVASNRDLSGEVAAGRFREDLYYRLNVMHFHLPPLRERPVDLPPLIRGLVARFAVKFHKPLRRIASAVYDRLIDCPWPGNLRQLENALQTAVLVATGDELRVEHLPPLPQSAEESGLALPRSGPGETCSHLARHRESSERRLILRALAKANGSRVATARALGISRVTLYKKMKKYGLLTASDGQAGPVFAEPVRVAG
ncbi:MAG TPA: sigma-54 dependent transcriptional regulator [Gemmatales bacterium]|nr:sigma-54 dependent transcriptional regulator [Gemmatales bacterium]